MLKLKPLFMTGILTTINFFGIVEVVTSAETFIDLKPNDQVLNQSKNSNLFTRIKQVINDNLSSSLQGIEELLGRRRRDDHTQGEFCLIAPGGRYRTTISQRPIFIIQGTVKKLIITDFDDNIIWEKDINDQQYSVTYDGEQPLEIGQKYLYSVQYETIENGQTVPKETEPMQITIMSDNDTRREITEKLAQIPVIMPNMTAEERQQIALQKALIFEEYSYLWWDVLQQLYAVENPDQQWLDILQQEREKVCNSQQETTN